MYDLLTCAGTYKDAELKVFDIGARFCYDPGTVVALAGKVLLHEVTEWTGGERICIARFIRDNVHNRVEVPRPELPLYDKYTSLMAPNFRDRHGLTTDL
jgi:hypothetical protein